MHFGIMQLLVLFISFAVCSGMNRKTGPSDKASSSNSATALITPKLSERFFHLISSAIYDFRNSPKHVGEEPNLEPVKIRVSYADNENAPGHAFVVIGDYEFDFLKGGSRRRKFRFDIDAKLEALNKKKAQPFKDGGLFVAPEKAEKVFFEMAERFWFKSSYNYNQANCLDYVFNFVNALFDGKGPKREMWPDNFIYYDNDMLKEYDKYYQTRKALKLSCEEERKPLSALDRLPIVLSKMPMIKTDLDLQKNCEFEYHRLKLLIENFSGDENPNFVLMHCTGRFRTAIKYNRDFTDRIAVETVQEKMTKNGKNINLEFVLKAYSCKIGGTEAKKAFITNFLLMNETKTKFIKPKKVCHSHQLGEEGINLDELTGHIISFDGEWAWS